jgi:hypothetical protein
VNRSYRNRGCSLVTAALVIGCLIFAPPVARESSATTLNRVTTDDKTASVGIPDGWKLVSGGNGHIYVTGPHDERINLASLVIGKNAAGGPLGGEIVFALPYGASLRDKFSAILQAGAAKQGTPALQLAFASEVPMRIPQCSRFLGGWTAGSDSQKFEALLCSFPPDILGLYKNLVFLAQVPASLAAQDRPIVEQIAQSYRVTPGMLKKMLAPYTTPRLPAGGGGGGFAAPVSPSQVHTDCYDYVIRESPPSEVPVHCGGLMPG